MRSLIQACAVVLVMVWMTAVTVSAFLVPWSEPVSYSSSICQQLQQQRVQTSQRTKLTTLFAADVDVENGFKGEEEGFVSDQKEIQIPEPVLDRFDLETALFCSGFAFDAYTEPPANSSRWERGVSTRETRGHTVLYCILMSFLCLLITVLLFCLFLDDR